MLNKVARGSLALRKIAASKNPVLGAAWKATKGVGKAYVKHMKKHPILGSLVTTPALLTAPPVAAKIIGARKAGKRMELMSAQHPGNIYPTRFWERPK